MKAFIKDDFNDLLEYRTWVDKAMKNLSSKNQIQLGMFNPDFVNRYSSQYPRWFGKGVTFEELNAGITQYKDPTLIEKIFEKVNGKLSPDLRNKVKARKVRFNPSGLGVFIFDRAAMGMYRLKEFHSPKHKRVVDQSEVKKIKANYVLKTDHSPVTQKWEERPEGKPKIRTTSKNVYAYYPPIRTEKQAVELFITCGGHSGIESEDFLYSGISALIVAQILESAKIKTRISIVIGASPDAFKKTSYAVIVPVKNYDERLDTNLLALLSSDPRFFRFEGFKGIVSVYDHFGATCPPSLGTGMTKDSLIETIENSGYAKKANLPDNRFYFGYAFSEREALNQIKDTVEEIANRFK
jgi:hypothetical protein